MLALFCVAWDSFLIFWYGVALGPAQPWIAFVFPVAHIGVGLFLTWATLAMFLNRTRVTVSTHELSVQHGPLPWSGSRRLASEQIEQIYCDQSVGHASGHRSSAAEFVSVNARLLDGRKVRLLSHIAEDEALFIEQEIERYLDLPDQRVPGEVRR